MNERHEQRTIGEVVNVGRDLREQLEQRAREQGRDATGLARDVLRRYLAEVRGGDESKRPGAA